MRHVTGGAVYDRISDVDWWAIFAGPLLVELDTHIKETLVNSDVRTVRTTRTFQYEGTDLPTLFQLAALDLAGVKETDKPSAVYAELDGTTTGVYTLAVTL